jgi:hypothetical protein
VQSLSSKTNPFGEFILENAHEANVVLENKLLKKQKIN